MPGGRGNKPNDFCKSPPKAQLRAPLSPCKQRGPVSTLIYIAVGRHQQAPVWWKVATARSHLYSTGAPPPGAMQDGVQCIPLYQSCRQPGRCPADGLTDLWGWTVKAQCLSACLPPRHPNSLWRSYRPRVVCLYTSRTRPTRVVLRGLLYSSLFTSAKF